MHIFTVCSKSWEFNIIGKFSAAYQKAAPQEYTLKFPDLNGKMQELKLEEAVEERQFHSGFGTCESYDKKIDNVSLQELAWKRVTRVSYEDDFARSLLKSPVAPLPKYNSAEGGNVKRFFASFWGYCQ